MNLRLNDTFKYDDIDYNYNYEQSEYAGYAE